MIKIDDLERKYGEYGVSVQRLMHWLQLPKQGVAPLVAVQVIQDVYKEMLKGNTPWMNREIYPEAYQRKFDEGFFPEHFWIDNYILIECRKRQGNLDVVENLKHPNTMLNIQSAFDRVAAEIATMRKMLGQHSKEIQEATGLAALVHDEFKRGKKLWEESFMQPEQYLGSIRATLSEGGATAEVERLYTMLGVLMSEASQTNQMLRPIKNFLTIPDYLKPKIWWKKLKRIAAHG